MCLKKLPFAFASNSINSTIQSGGRDQVILKTIFCILYDTILFNFLKFNLKEIPHHKGISKQLESPELKYRQKCSYCPYGYSPPMFFKSNTATKLQFALPISSSQLLVPLSVVSYPLINLTLDTTLNINLMSKRNHKT